MKTKRIAIFVIFLLLPLFASEAKAQYGLANDLRPKFSVQTCDVASLNRKPVCLPEEYSQYFADEFELMVGDSLYRPMPGRIDEMSSIRRAIAEGVAEEYERVSESLTRRLNLKFEEQNIVNQMGFDKIVRMRFKNINNEREMTRWLSVFALDPNVKRIYFSSVVRTLGQSQVTGHTDDPDVKEQWYLEKEKFHEAHQDESAGFGSPEIHIGFFDTGYDATHEDLPQPTGGYDHLYYKDEVLEDFFGHGTANAGVILQIPNNQKGGVGTSPGVSFWVRRVMDNNGIGQWWVIAEAIVAQTLKCKNLREENQNVRCIFTFSIGGLGPVPSIDKAIDYAFSEGIVVVAAAANWPLSLDRVPVYPAAKPGVIPVAALDQLGALASFSGYGTNLPMVAAGGVLIYTTVPKQSFLFKTTGGYRTVSGTSYAAPQVAGAIALMWTKHRDLTREKIVFATLGGSEAIPGLEKQITSGGILDALLMLDIPKEKPATPENFSIINTSHISIETQHISRGKVLGFAHYLSEEPFEETELSRSNVKMFTTIKPSNGTVTFNKLLLNLTESTTFFQRMQVFDRGGNMSDITPLLETTTKKSELFKQWTFTKENGGGDPGNWTPGDGPLASIAYEFGFPNPNLWHISDMLLFSNGFRNWRLGDENFIDFLTGYVSDTMVSSEIIDLTGLNGASMSFDYFQSTTPLVLWDEFYVYASPVDNYNKEVGDSILLKQYIATDNNTRLELKEQFVDLSMVAGQRFKLSFRVYAKTGGVMGGLGWMFGNVKIFTDERFYLY